MAKGWGFQALLAAICLAGFSLAASVARAQVPTTLEDYFLPGTQPDRTGLEIAPIIRSSNCRNCHELYAPGYLEVPIYDRWAASGKAQAARDPIFQATLAIANQDASFAGDLCIRCHVPRGWLGGRSTPTNGSALQAFDFDGVTCNFCHRAVDPVFKPGISPQEDVPILQELLNAGTLPAQHGNGGYVISPEDVRRGPLDDVPENYHGVPIIVSDFHKRSEICATCHDVSNPAVTRQPGGSYALNAFGAPHETLDKYDMFPLERTYSEWLKSAYANGGVDAGGVFGGDHPTGVMQTCQDCHMPRSGDFASVFTDEPFFYRPDVPSHDFNGGNTWLQHLIANLYPGLVDPIYLENSQARARYMLENAATLAVVVQECAIRVRITNETGHKLPTGYIEGRRMWINVEFRDAALDVLAERGAYEFESAELTHSDTKVYESESGVDAAASALTGIPEGPSFHLAVANKIFKDNRIPPRGFNNAAFAAVQAAPVGATYADGQHWDETTFHVPPGATGATVRVYYQTASKDYITFLRDANTTNTAGDILYEQWQLTGMSPPVLMRELDVNDLSSGIYADTNCDGFVDLTDFDTAGTCVTGLGAPLQLGCEAMDAELDGDVDLHDFGAYQNAFTGAP